MDNFLLYKSVSLIFLLIFVEVAGTTMSEIAIAKGRHEKEKGKEPAQKATGVESANVKESLPNAQKSTEVPDTSVRINFVINFES